MALENFAIPPSIKIEGKVITPNNPRMKAWRKYLEFFDQDEEVLRQKSLAEYTDSMIELIVLGFNAVEVTKEALEEVLGVGEVKPLMLKVFRWLQTIFFIGLENLPKNAEEAADS